MNKLINKKLFIILPFILAVICAVVIYSNSRTLTISFDVINMSQEIGDYTISQEEGHVSIDDAYIKNSRIFIKVGYVSPGIDYIQVETAGEHAYFERIIVHKSGLITETYYLGNCSGSWIIPACAFVYFLLAFCALIHKYRRDTAEDLYQYRNITTFGLIVFIGFLLLVLLLRIFTFEGLYSYLVSILGSAGSFSMITFPVAFVLSILIMISNINLMRKEGRNLRNMLGIIRRLIFDIDVQAGKVFPARKRHRHMRVIAGVKTGVQLWVIAHAAPTQIFKYDVIL